MSLPDLIGNRYGLLTVLSLSANPPTKRRYWECICDCGNTKTVITSSLISGKVWNCGCSSKLGNTTHGMSYSREMSSYKSMIRRCRDSSHPKSGDRYAKRGITVCQRWLESFENFYEDMGVRPEGTSLDRIDNDGNYEKGNCRWANSYEQSYNKSTTIWLDYQGERLTIPDFSRLVGITEVAIKGRLIKGATVEQIANRYFGEELLYTGEPLMTSIEHKGVIFSIDSEFNISVPPPYHFHNVKNKSIPSMIIFNGRKKLFSLSKPLLLAAMLIKPCVLNSRKYRVDFIDNDADNLDPFNLQVITASEKIHKNKYGSKV